MNTSDGIASLSNVNNGEVSNGDSKSHDISGVKSEKRHNVNNEVSNVGNEPGHDQAETDAERTNKKQRLIPQNNLSSQEEHIISNEKSNKRNSVDDTDHIVDAVNIQQTHDEIHSALSSACSSPVHEEEYESSGKDSNGSISSSAASSWSSHQVPPAPPCTPVPNRSAVDMNMNRKQRRFQDLATPKSDSSQSFSKSNHDGPDPFDRTNSGEQTQKTSHATQPTHTILSDNFDSWKVGTRYELIRILGRGSYGEVAQARDIEASKNLKPGDPPKYVAIKKIAMAFDQEVDALRFYREIHLLRMLRGHDCIIQLIDMIAPESENIEDFNDIYLVFEYVDTDLYKLIMSPQYLTTAHIKTFLYQILKALKYIHSCSVIHRDLKPANILLNEDCSLKICDFGLARIVDQGNMAKNSDDTSSSSSSEGVKNRPTEGLKRQLTKHVVTRWYRAPELILIQPYSSAVDIWSVGCIFAELLSMQEGSVPSYEDRVPLFPGGSCFPLSGDKGSTAHDSERLDQLSVILDVIGTPCEEDIQSIGKASEYIKSLKKCPSKSLDKIYPAADPAAIDLLKKMLQFNPLKRCTSEEAIGHDFFKGIRQIETELSSQKPLISPAFIEADKVNVDEIKKEALKEILWFKSNPL